MRTVFILVVCLCTAYVVVESAIPTAYPMSCTMDGTITYTGVPNGVKSVASDCGQHTLNVDTHTLVITGCPLETVVSVNLYNRNTPASSTSAASTPGPPATSTPAVSTPGPPATSTPAAPSPAASSPAASTPAAPTSTTHSFVLDGDRALQLTCTKVADGNAYTVQVQVPGSDAPTVFTSEEQISLTMFLTDTNNNNIPKTVALGQTYDLHVSGGGTHFLKIETCKAAGNDQMTGSVLVYNTASGSDSIGLITPVAGGNNGQLTAILKGFRLLRSSVVILQCDIRVCNNDPCPSGRKRKRTKPKLKTASVRFEVMSTRLAQAANGARDMNSAGRNMMTLVLVVVASYLSF